MSRSHRSLKLLNSASLSIDNKLILNTELDNTLIAGDYVWITGGYYDNTDYLLYSNSWTSVDNVFTSVNKKPYKVLSVNPLNNSFTLDISITGTLFYPYCVQGNTINNTADPTNTVDLAYNNINVAGNVYDMYKSVYVSQYVAPKPRIISATVNNGTFGTDKTTVNFGLYPIDGLVSLMHGGFKNINAENVIVDSKSLSSGLVTNKIMIDQNLSFTLVPTGLDNNSQGYSSFEKANINLSNLIRSEIENARANYININGCNASFCILGSKNTIEENGNLMYLNSITNDVIIRNITINGITNVSGNNIIIDGTSHIDLFGISAKISGHKITFTGFSNIFGMYNTLKPISTSTGYISGFIGNDGKQLNLLNGQCKINDNYYSYGNPNTGDITIEFDNLLSGSILAQFISEYTDGFGNINSINLINSFKNITLYYNQSTIIEGSLNILGQSGETKINAIGQNAFIECLDGSIDTINILGGFYNNFGFYGNIKMEASLPTPVYLSNCFQSTDDIYTPNFNYVNILNSTTGNIFSANFNNSIIEQGYYSNSIFINSYITSTSVIKTLLYNSIIGNYTKVDTNVDWEYVKFNSNASIAGFYQNTSSGYVFIKNNDFQGRTYPIICGNSNQLPITSPVFNWNLNNKKTNVPPDYNTGIDTQALGVQPQLSFVNPYSNDVYAQPKTRHNAYTSSTALTAGGLSTTDNYALFDLGTLIESYPSYIPRFDRNKIIFARRPASDVAFNDILNNVITNNITVNDLYLVLSDSSPYAQTVDASQVFSTPYFKKNPPLSRANTMACSFTNAPIDVGFPVVSEINIVAYKNSISSFIPIMEYDGTTGTINLLGADDYQIYLDVLAWADVGMTTPAIQVPSNYVEVEYIKTEYCDILPPATYNINNYILRKNSFTASTFNDENTIMPWTNPATVGSHPVRCNMFLNFNYTGIPTRFEISLWLTEYNSNPTFENCGKKIHKVIEIWLG